MNAQDKLVHAQVIPPPVGTATLAVPIAAPTQSGPLPPEDPQRVTFSDVYETDYFFLSATYMVSRGWISGYTDGTFRPWDDTTRGQFSKIMVNSEEWLTNTVGGPHFADVPTTNTFYDVIETAYNRQIINGYPCGGPGEPCDGQNRPYFRPWSFVTRGQMAKMIVLAQGWPLSNPPTATFNDVPVGSTFFQYVETAVSYTILSGYSCGTGCREFRPLNLSMRGQVTKVVYNSVEWGHVHQYGFDFQHPMPTPFDASKGVHQGSNNYQCTTTDGNRCTAGAAITPHGYFIVNNSSNGTNFYNMSAQELQWTDSAKTFLVNTNGGKVDAIVFHAFKWDDAGNCTQGAYQLLGVFSSLPSFDKDRDYVTKQGCAFSDNNEARILLRHPEEVYSGISYYATVEWSTNTVSQGEYYPGQLTVDNYLLNTPALLGPGPEVLVREFMTKFCYQRDVIGECPR